MKINKKITKIFLLSALMTTSSYAAWYIEGKKVMENNPLSINLRSIETGGTKTAIEAYSDGVGLFISGNGLNSESEINNSSFNELVFKVGELAKKNNLNISDQLLSNTNNFIPTAEDISNANKIKLSIDKTYINLEGQACDDNNAQTTGDIYVSGTSIGTSYHPDDFSDIAISSSLSGYGIARYRFGTFWIANTSIGGAHTYSLNPTDIFVLTTTSGNRIAYTNVVRTLWSNNGSYGPTDLYINGTKINIATAHSEFVALLGSDFRVDYSWNSTSQSFRINENVTVYKIDGTIHTIAELF